MKTNTKSYKKFILSKKILKLVTMLFAVISFIGLLENKTLSLWLNLGIVAILSFFLYYGSTCIFYLYYSTTAIDED